MTTINEVVYDARVRIANERLKKQSRDCWNDSVTYCRFYGDEKCKYTCGYALNKNGNKRS